MGSGRLISVVLAACAVTAAAAGTARADRVHVSAADQAAAKRDVLHLADLPTGTTWKATNLSSKGSGDPGSCSKLDSSRSDVVDTGDAISQFAAPGILVLSSVGLVQSKGMLDVLWKHTFASSPTNCIRDAFAQGAAGRLKIVSTTKLALPELARYQHAYRLRFQVKVQGVTEAGAFDLVMMGSGRTVSMLLVGGIIGPMSQQKEGELALSLIDLKLAETVASRAFKQPSSALTA